MKIFVVRLGALVAAPVLSLGLAATVPPADAASPSSAGAAGWLAGQLTGGVIHNDQYDFDDYGLTADTGLALADIGVQGTALGALTSALATHVDDYTEPNGAPYVSAGATAKAATLAIDAGLNPNAFGDANLVSRLEGRVGANGRISDSFDPSDPYGADYANEFGQAFAVEALSAVSSPKAASATSYLLAQQCPSGSFRLSFPSTSADTPCTTDPSTPPGADTTALAVLALQGQVGNAQVSAALGRAVAYLKSTQATDGSFTDGNSPNTNSTGLAASALGESCATAVADRAAAYVRSLQVAAGTTDSLASAVGAIAYDPSALAAGRTNGITTETQDQWRRATAQAASALEWDASATTPLKLTTASYVKAGAKATITVTGAKTGQRVCLSDGTTSTPLTATGPSFTTKVALPSGSGSQTFTATTGPGSATAKVQVLAKKKPHLKVAKVLTRGDKAVIRVRGLAKGEKVRIFLGGQRVDMGKATRKGLFVSRFVVHHGLGKTKLKVLGQFGSRKNVKTIRVVH